MTAPSPSTGSNFCFRCSATGPFGSSAQESMSSRVTATGVVSVMDGLLLSETDDLVLAGQC